MRCVATLLPCLSLTLLLSTGCRDRTSIETAKAADAAPAAGASAVSQGGSDSADAAAVEAMMRRVYDGFVRHDAAGINAAVPASGMIYVDPAGVTRVTSPDGTTEMVKQCTVRSYAMDSVQTSAPAPALALLTFKLTIDETCGGQKTPSPLYVMSSWQRHDNAWQATAFSATPAVAAR